MIMHAFRKIFRSGNNNVFEGSYYRLRIDEDQRNRLNTMGRDPFGVMYYFTLKEKENDNFTNAVDDCPEYLIPFPVLQRWINPP